MGVYIDFILDLYNDGGGGNFIEVFESESFEAETAFEIGDIELVDDEDDSVFKLAKLTKKGMLLVNYNLQGGLDEKI